MLLVHVYAECPYCMSILHVNSTFLCCMYKLLVHAAWALQVHLHAACSSMLHVPCLHAACPMSPCCMSNFPCCMCNCPCCLSMLHVILHVYAACLFFMSMLHFCCVSMLNDHAACPCCISAMHSRAACPRYMSMLHVHVQAACPCQLCVSMSILHVHVDTACSCHCCISMSMPHAHVHAACPCPCRMSMFILHVLVHAACSC
jgi:hypothetical protein